MWRGLRVLLMCCCVATAVSAREVVLISAEWPPFVSASQHDGGVVSKMVRSVLQRAGYRVQLRLESWPRAEALVREGKAFATFPYIATEQRRQHFDFSQPLLSTSGYFFYYRPALNKIPDYRQLRDLQPYRIGTARGYWYDKLFAEAGLRVMYTDNEEAVIRQLRLGRVDLAPLTLEQGWYLISRLYPEDKRRFATLPQPLNNDSPLCLMVSRRYPYAATILQDFDKALLQMRASGELDALYRTGMQPFTPPPSPG